MSNFQEDYNPIVYFENKKLYVIVNKYQSLNGFGWIPEFKFEIDLKELKEALENLDG